MNDEWHALMRRGEFEAAWRLSDQVRGEHLWDGEPLDGKRVILLCNRGLGDAIQFIRYVPMVARVAREVTVWARPDAVQLLRCARGVARVEPWDVQVEGDVALDIMQLPHVFRTTLETIPNEVPYLEVEPVELGEGFHVGVGIKTSWWDPERDVPEELIGLVPRVHRLDQPFGPATPLETARLVKALDLVISADTFFAHLAGALAVPVWTLLHANADWRWLESRSDSPWYPTMRLYRQREPGNWRTIVREVQSDLCYLPRTFHRS